MENTQYHLELLKVAVECLRILIWPVFVSGVLYVYRTQIKNRFEDIKELSVGGVSILFRVREIAESKPKDLTELMNSIKKLEQDLAINQFVEIASKLHSEPTSINKYLNPAIEDLSKSLTLPTILSFSRSDERGEREGAGIALRKYILANPEASNSPDVKVALRRGIQDRISRVQRAFIEAIGASKLLAKEFEDELKTLANVDDSPGVRDQATRVLASIS